MESKTTTYTVRDLHEAAMERYDHAALVTRGHAGQPANVPHARRALIDAIAAAAVLPPDPRNEPTRSILYQSAAAIAYNAKLPHLAHLLIYRAYQGSPNAYTIDNLRELRSMLDREALPRLVSESWRLVALIGKKRGRMMLEHPLYPQHLPGHRAKLAKLERAHHSAAKRRDRRTEKLRAIAD